MKLNVFSTPAELNESLAQNIITVANNAIAEKGRFDFVLTGGSSPKALYQLLSTDHEESIDWSKVFFFFGDERTVKPFEPDYNGLMAKQSFFDNLDLAENQIFYVNTNLNPADAATDYFDRIRKHFNGESIVFDFVLLGMGDDAHTASIFPHTSLVVNDEIAVADVYVDKLNTFRVSFTAKLINQAKNIAFITFGVNKANAIAKVFGEEKDFQNYPSQLIAPIDGDLQWYIDEAAASLL